MIEQRLFAALERAATRYRKLRFWQSLAVAWLATALCGAVVAAAIWTTAWRPSHPVVILAGLALAAIVGSMIRAAASARNYHWVAMQIEERYPELKSCLLTAMEQRPELPGGRFGFLQDRVIRQALYHAQQHAWPRVVSTQRMTAAVLANAATLALLVAVLTVLGTQSSRLGQAALSPGELQSIGGGKLSVTVEPGNAEVERGTSLLVLARYQGDQPADCTLVYQASGVDAASCRVISSGRDAASTGEANRLAMSKTLKDPVFGGRIPAVDAPLDYHIDLAGYKTETFHVTVFEYPKLVRADAKLVYPSYAGLDERLIQDVRTITAPEGAELTLICRLNKAVATATLESRSGIPAALAAQRGRAPRLPALAEKDAAPIELAPAEGETSVYQATFRCDRSRRLELTLVDAEGRRNKLPADFTIKVLPNQPPDLKLAFPARDVEVSPLEETDVKATAWDDYGLKRFGLSYALAGDAPKEIVLGQEAAAKQRHELADVIRFEELQAEPDQLLSYYFWAEDLDAAGKLRRTESDMYFAEVRPFEEIFRQGEQPPGGQSQQQQQGGQNAQAAEQLAELEKQIIAATWKLIRRETGEAPSDAFKGDVHLVGESQASAWEQATELSQKLQDPQSQRHAAAVIEAMLQAIEHLTAAEDGPGVKPLQPALAAEQAAYQALLKLRAREHRVIRGQQQQGGAAGGAANRSQQQLQQLELSNDENRYETQRTAQSPQQQQEREDSQVLNRLSELARRQDDLNERLKELQSALEEAQTEQDREEIRKQLKRLREEQQQILRDTDELKSRMDAPENQERMADSREQLEQTREQVRRASEALDQEQVSQAAAAGTRAERDFQELRNDFRRRSSSRFNEEMREMRDAARELEEKEQQLAERLAAPEEDRREKRSLRNEGFSENEKLPLEFEQQRRRVEDLVERMQETIREAEQVEPLLSERLYDTARKALEKNPSQALEAAELSVQRGLEDDARQQESVARQGISDMRAGIERAAESVLGDETEALRRAEQELERLAEELNDEIARNSDEPRDRQQPGEGRSRRADGSQENRSDREAQSLGQEENADQQRQGQRGQGQQNQGQQNEDQPNEDQPNEGQQGEGQPNEGQRGQGQPGQRQPGGRQRGGGLGGGPQNLAGPVGPGGFDWLSDGQLLNPSTAPIAGEDFRGWSDRLRDVEEMVDDPELRAEAARIRDRARGIRGDSKRHSKPPDWNLVRVEVSEPLVELRNRVAEELLRRTNKDAILPLDRDPVPPKYSEKTRRYYEQLGSGE
ncbi:MAG TPA: hypothetical protein VMV10_24670 [Pirellulales bacterium]|nr:hypothetical protein [Pirellulales bacterium]